MTDLLNTIGRHKGKTFAVSLLAAAVLLWAARGCSVKVESLEIRARTNATQRLTPSMP